MIKLGREHSVSLVFALNCLTYVSGLIGFLSVVKYVLISFSIFFILIMFAAFFFDYHKRYAISRRLLNSMLLLFVALNILRISLDNFAAPLVETILILMAVKFLEEKKARDYMQIYILATFLLAGSALLSLDLQFLMNFLLLTVLLPVCMVLLTFHSEQSITMLTGEQLRMIVSRALLIPLFSIPMTVLMFVCLPRTGYPLFDFLNARGSSAGFTDHVTLGDISGIQENSSVILRVESAQVDPQMLYWRGIVMDSFDGKSWRGAGRPRRREGVFQLEGRRLVQTIYLEPYGNRYLFALEKPVSLQYRDASVSEDFTITAKRDIDQRIRYSVVSVLSGYDRLESIERNKYLQLPTAGLERIRPLVGRLTTGTGTEADALSILHYLTDGTFKYSLKNLPVTSEPIEDFLLIHKSGNCEYFASSMAVMLRMAGIPARLVGGYHGGVYNAIGGYYIVTQNNAHVWVEVYLDNKGWVRMDPTPASGAAVPKGRQSLAFKLRLLLDAANYYWNSMVITYDLNRQVSLLSDFKNAITAPRVDITAVKRPAVLLTLIAISFTAIAIGIARFIKRRKPEVLVMERFARIMKKYGYVRSAAEGLREFAARIDNIPLRNKVIVFISEIEKIYYRDRVMTEADQVSLMRFLEDI